MTDLVNVGASANDSTGDTLRVAFAKINARYQDILGTLTGGSVWATGVTYQALPARDWVVQAGEAYVCLISHTAGVFATDLAAGRWASFDALDLRFDLSQGTGATITGFVQPASGAVAITVAQKLSERLSIVDFGGVPNSGLDQTAAAANLFAAANLLKKPWFIPAGQYIINPTTSIKVQTSGVCEGEFLVPKSNINFFFHIERDFAGASVSANSWANLVRGSTQISAANSANKYVLISSPEPYADRIGSSPYLKQEFVRIDAQGSLTEPLNHSYDNSSSITAISYAESSPIEIYGLRVVRDGAGPAGLRGSIVVNRDRVTLTKCQVVNSIPSVPLPFAFEVGYCADVVMQSCYVNGCNFPGLGYGVVATATRNLRINDQTAIDCRHGFSGAYNIGVHIDGGLWHSQIDDHWGDNMIIENAKIRSQPGDSCILFSGRNISVRNCEAYGGRSFFAIREDCPYLGGTVSIKNINVVSPDGGSAYYFFGFTFQDDSGPIAQAFAVKPYMPDHLVVEDINLQVNASFPVIIYLGLLQKAHTNFGLVSLRGNITCNVDFFGVFALKNSSFNQDRDCQIFIDGPIDFKLGSVVNLVALDGSYSRPYSCTINGVVSGSLRYSAYSIGKLVATNSTISNITDDNTSAGWGNSLCYLSNCVMRGGVVGPTIRNHAFYSCNFSGLYTNFPANFSLGNWTSFVALIGCTTTVSQPNMPTNLLTNLASPFN